MKKSIALLIIIILISLLYIIQLKDEIHSLSSDSFIIGSYISEASENTNSHYLVFDKGNKFYRYKQFELLDEGTYLNYDDDIYLLEGLNDKNWLIKNDDTIYFFDDQRNEINSFTKIKDVPLFINLKR